MLPVIVNVTYVTVLQTNSWVLQLHLHFGLRLTLSFWTFEVILTLIKSDYWHFWFLSPKVILKFRFFPEKCQSMLKITISFSVFVRQICLNYSTHFPLESQWSTMNYLKLAHYVSNTRSKCIFLFVICNEK